MSVRFEVQYGTAEWVMQWQEAEVGGVLPEASCPHVLRIAARWVSRMDVLGTRGNEPRASECCRSALGCGDGGERAWGSCGSVRDYATRHQAIDRGRLEPVHIPWDGTAWLSACSRAIGMSALSAVTRASLGTKSINKIAVRDACSFTRRLS